MKLLLHTCCAPCLIYPLRRLREKGYEVVGIFYNPNIHPFSEYRNRKQAVVDFSKKFDLELIYPEYRPHEFFNAVNLKETKPGRCEICWKLRLEETARQAREKGYRVFTTTLLVSPYQDQELLKEIGGEVTRESKVEFYYEDFRSGFRKAHDEARALGLYCQKYCGCIYSGIERDKSK